MLLQSYVFRNSLSLLDHVSTLGAGLEGTRKRVRKYRRRRRIRRERRGKERKRIYAIVGRIEERGELRHKGDVMVTIERIRKPVRCLLHDDFETTGAARILSKGGNR
jgi:hypothetical protein